MTTLLKQGEGIKRMMEVTGEEGVTFEAFFTYQESLTQPAIMATNRAR